MPSYLPIRISRSEYVEVRGLRYHCRVWDAVPGSRSPLASSSGAATLFMLHGWMDVGASFQFLVDHLAAGWRVIAPDWRGYGLTAWPDADCYWFPDYLADLDHLLDHYSPGQAVRLVGHSMGGNVSMIYAGVRPQRIARLVNLEGVGLRPLGGDQAPERYATWLDQVRQGSRLRDYDSQEAVIARLMQTNPRLRPDFATFLAGHWSQRQENGRYRLLGDPAHKLINPDLYRVDEIVACWRRISADVMLVTARHVEGWRQFIHSEEYAQRLAAIGSLQRVELDDAGHMLHHDQPRAVADLIEGFMH